MYTGGFNQSIGFHMITASVMKELNRVALIHKHLQKKLKPGKNIRAKSKSHMA